jgi:hypothetical protein
MLGRDERGLALTSSLALLSTVAVVVAGIAFFATSPTKEPVEAAQPVVASTPVETPTSTAPEPTVTKEPVKKPRKPAVERAKVYVEVYNNTNIAGLAGRTATRASDAGWQVVGSDNWVGTIPASTVYYPPRLKAAARLLSKDLGVNRLMPAVAPMRLDRLTVILTG